MSAAAAAQNDVLTSNIKNEYMKKEKPEHNEKAERRISTGSDTTLTNNDVNSKLANPLAGRSKESLYKEADTLADKYDLQDIQPLLRKGALVAQAPVGFDEIQELSEDEKEALRSEFTHKWRQPKKLYLLVFACSMAAVVQGQDQSLINGANLFWPSEFGIGTNSQRDTWLVGLVNAAPYFGCVLFSCWMTQPLNHYFGRRGCILISLVFATFPCLWAAFTNSWPHLFATRLVLSMGIGPKSSTVPIYAAECAPPAIRGALVMQWQTWTAFGIMIGYVCSLIFYNVSSDSIEGLNWRLTLGSGIVPPIIVFLQVLWCPESPRWYLQKGKARKAYESLLQLRNTPIEAARDLFYISVLLREEEKIEKKNLFLQLFNIPRNRRATQGATLVMFMQQFCGINVVAYYSSTILVENGFSQLQALLGSFGFGLINWLFAYPGMFTIDRFGRRTLLLFTFPIMGFFLAFTGSMFYLPDSTGKLAAILLGIYMFAMAYSPGEGPVPFTYSAEAFPLYIRPLGMSWATAVCWGFNGVLAITFPSLNAAFTPSGAFYYYAAWNLVGWFLVLLFLPETKQLSLEELDAVFSVPTRRQAAWGLKQPGYWVGKYILRKDIKQEPLFELDPSMSRTYAPKSGGH